MKSAVDVLYRDMEYSASLNDVISKKLEKLNSELEINNKELIKENINLKVKENNICERFKNEIKSIQMLNEQLKEDLRIKNNRQIPDSERSEFEKYQIKVRNLTNKVKSILYENWNGFDYYDNEFIKNNINYKFYDRNYPTIDHKISIYYGFVNNISPEIIGNLENLCITKRGINSKKNNKNEEFFIN